MEQKDYRLAAILYTDIAGFSRMMEKDEAATLKILNFHNNLITEAAERRHGTVIKTIGDAFLVDFRNTVEALQAALEIQDKFYAYNLEHRDLPLLVRMGIHLGDIYFFENDALGEGINIAARLQSLAHPGAICMSSDVYNQVLNKIDFQAVRLGKVSLKNITKEIHAYEISSANVEFDPDHDKPRPGYQIGTYADIPDSGKASRQPSEETEKAAPKEGIKADSGHAPDSSANVLAEIRAAILADTKAEGKRLTVEEALRRYGDYGIEAKEVIARMADQGLLLKKAPESSSTFTSASSSPRPESFDGEALGRDIERAVRGIVSVVEDKIGDYEKDHRYDSSSHHNHHSHSGHYSMDSNERHAMRDEIRAEYRHERHRDRQSEQNALREELRDHASEVETGQWDKELKDSDYFKPGREELTSSTFEEYRSGLENKADRLRRGFAGHLISFVGVNALLWTMNIYLHIGPSFLWAAIVTAGWGTGLVSNIVGIFRANAKRREAEHIPDLGSEALATYKKINTVRDSMVRHTTSVFTVPALLFTIHHVVTPTIFPWWLIPSGIMAISWISHLAAYGSSKRRLESKLFTQSNAPGGWRDLFRMGKARRAAVKVSGPYASLYEEAEAAKEAIAAQIRSAGKDSPFDKELIPSLEEYVGQVKLLTQTVNEVDSIIDSIPMKDLEKDKAELRGKLDAKPSESLRTEYVRSIDEIEKQEKSYKDLQDQREVLHLRLKSSVNSLKQMQLDMARLRANPDDIQSASLEQVRSKTGELSRYLEDLRKGYEETRDAEDPWKDLERQAKEREEKARLPAEKNETPKSKAPLGKPADVPDNKDR
jgi:class 3 adenylate cyclase